MMIALQQTMSLLCSTTVLKLAAARHTKRPAYTGLVGPVPGNMQRSSEVAFFDDSADNGASPELMLVTENVTYPA